MSLVVRKGDLIMVGGKERKLSTLALFTGASLTLGHGRHAAGGRQFTFAAKFSDGFSAILRVQPGSAPVVLAEKSGPVGPASPGAPLASLGSPCVTDDAANFSFLGKLVPNVGGVTTASAGAILTENAGVNGVVAPKTFAAPGVNGASFFDAQRVRVCSRSGAGSPPAVEVPPVRATVPVREFLPHSAARPCARGASRRCRAGTSSEG